MQETENPYRPLLVPLDVSDVYGNKIIKAGTEITPELMENIGRSGKFASTCRLSLSGSKIRKDMESALQRSPYTGMFPPGRIDDILRLYDDLRILPVLFEEFEFMRNRDVYVYEHVLTTAALTASLAIDLYGKDRASLIGYTALTHDLGMVRLPDNVLKHGIGNDTDKRCLLYGHTIIGYVLLTYYMGSVQFGNCRVAFEHHERGNGTGYPRGIKLNDSVIELISVADVFDALISVRPFRNEPFELRSALDLLWNEARQGTLNPQVVKLLISYNRQGYFTSEGMAVADEERGRLPLDNRYIDWSAYQHKDCLPSGQKKTK
jgi:HD-GYP domain-containing protein (c-di-GMP phosphodiesterase class II)